MTLFDFMSQTLVVIWTMREMLILKIRINKLVLVKIDTSIKKYSEIM